MLCDSQTRSPELQYLLITEPSALGKLVEDGMSESLTITCYSAWTCLVVEFFRCLYKTRIKDGGPKITETRYSIQAKAGGVMAHM